MRKHWFFLSVLLLVFVPRITRAQQSVLSPDRQAAILEAGRLLNDPVQFVLQYRQELALTKTQVTSLEQLATALRDSTSARTALRVQQAQQTAKQPGFANVMEFTGPIDESAIRETMRQQSAMQADIMIASARDRRAVGALLSAEQRAQLPHLQMSEMMKAARAGAK
jgi:competence protein ComGC